MSTGEALAISSERLELLKKAFSLRYTDLVLTPEQEEYFEQMRKVHEAVPSNTIKYK